MKFTMFSEADILGACSKFPQCGILLTILVTSKHTDARMT